MSSAVQVAVLSVPRQIEGNKCYYYFSLKFFNAGYSINFAFHFIGTVNNSLQFPVIF